MASQPPGLEVGRAGAEAATEGRQESLGAPRPIRDAAERLELDGI